ncbi:hypothetical protein P9X25_21980, partial [Bacillus cereus]|nr:hypothetical protein [Bacillus cereus]
VCALDLTHQTLNKLKKNALPINLLVVEELIVAELMMAMFRIVLIHHLWSTFFMGTKSCWISP